MKKKESHSATNDQNDNTGARQNNAGNKNITCINIVPEKLTPLGQSKCKIDMKKTPDTFQRMTYIYVVTV